MYHCERRLWLRRLVLFIYSKYINRPPMCEDSFSGCHVWYCKKNALFLLVLLIPFDLTTRNFPFYLVIYSKKINKNRGYHVCNYLRRRVSRAVSALLTEIIQLLGRIIDKRRSLYLRDRCAKDQAMNDPPACTMSCARWRQFVGNNSRAFAWERSVYLTATHPLDRDESSFTAYKSPLIARDSRTPDKSPPRSSQ